jgi:hypothetical protein
MTNKIHIPIFSVRFGVLFAIMVVLPFFSLAVLLSLTPVAVVDASSNIDKSQNCYDGLAAMVECAGKNSDRSERTIDADIPSVIGIPIPFP